MGAEETLSILIQNNLDREETQPGSRRPTIPLRSYCCLLFVSGLRRISLLKNNPRSSQCRVLGNRDQWESPGSTKSREDTEQLGGYRVRFIQLLKYVTEDSAFCSTNQISRHREAFAELNWFPAVNGDTLTPLRLSSQLGILLCGAT